MSPDPEGRGGGGHKNGTAQSALKSLRSHLSQQAYKIFFIAYALFKPR